MENKELNFDIFIANIDLNTLALELANENHKVIKHDNHRNPFIVTTLGELAQSVKRLAVIYQSTANNNASQSEKTKVMGDLIKSHQTLLNLQTKLREDDTYLTRALSRSAALLTPLYPLFLINEVFESQAKKTEVRN